MAYDRKAPRPTNDSPIARRRLALGLTQAQLADIIGCYAKDICRWEKGERNPKTKSLVAIAEALKCKIDDLL